MNIFIPLLAGIVIGYLLRGRKVRTDAVISVTLLILIFLMGINAGEVRINAGWLIVSSVVFAALTVAGSVGMALLIGVRE